MATETGLTTIKSPENWEVVNLFNVNGTNFLRFRKTQLTYSTYFCLKVDSLKIELSRFRVLPELLMLVLNN
ncbi:hypothetical protein [Okeania sp. SIO2B3]|uniref:hypothetical protein n=1 Tax=Okeania sp. SIO2B3 TaxID=2607784 RepID=UPI0013BF13DC|nr:hypothetical protein [Okeania sp. SIO2B3]NET41922.1 hypothetical protein [Okeania sp. SIO2B3]